MKSDDENSSNTSDPLMVEVSPRSSSPDGELVPSAKHPPASSVIESAMVVPPSNSKNNCMITLIDRLLQRYVTYMSSALHQDRGLKFLQWTLWLMSRLLQNKKPVHSKNLRKLYLDLSFARYANRLLGLPAALEAVRSGSWTPSSARHPIMMKWIGRLLAWSMVVYYPTEHAAYVQWMLPSSFPPSKRTAERWSYISCRAWLVYLVAEVTQCLVQWRELTNRAKQDNEDDDINKEAKYDRQVALRKTKVLLTRDLLFLLPCINWSLPNWDVDPWLPESIVNTLVWLESVVCLTQS